MLLLHAAAEQTHKSRGQRKQANDTEYRQQIVVNVRNRVAKPRAEGGHADGPEQTAENVRKKGSVLKVEMNCDCCHTGSRLDCAPKQGEAHDLHHSPLSALSQ